MLTNSKYYITEASVDNINIITWNSELEQERQSAVFDLLNNGKFKLLKDGETGPYEVTIKLVEWKLILNVLDLFDAENTEIRISISGIRRIMRDYQIVCENYVEAIKTAPLKRIEAIDVGRRSIHDEGAEKLLEIFKDQVELDMDTARRIFTLMSIISVKI
ncbi:MAG: hypothetical protein CMP36_02880 [Rickettsiales bacterium]|nr:hypothetical protein [Rickettsiales bacterium]OUV79496.1 MAG: hypothetical protein CBC91_03565 [Rickettsiales bacterium TMED131]